jgi:hypothetical protein
MDTSIKKPVSKKKKAKVKKEEPVKLDMTFEEAIDLALKTKPLKKTAK